MSWDSVHITLLSVLSDSPISFGKRILLCTGSFSRYTNPKSYTFICYVKTKIRIHKNVLKSKNIQLIVKLCKLMQKKHKNSSVLLWFIINTIKIKTESI